MRVLIQRVKKARVVVEEKIVADIAGGFLLFVGVCTNDDSPDVDLLVEKIPNLRVFDDEQGRMNVGAMEKGAQYLVVSQFTLYADCQKGRRPSFDLAAPAEKGRRFYEEFVHKLSLKCPGKVQTGIFGASMQVELVNDGPVTLWIDSKKK